MSKSWFGDKQQNYNGFYKVEFDLNVFEYRFVFANPKPTWSTYVCLDGGASVYKERLYGFVDRAIM